MKDLSRLRGKETEINDVKEKEQREVIEGWIKEEKKSCKWKKRSKGKVLNR